MNKKSLTTIVVIVLIIILGIVLINNNKDDNVQNQVVIEQNPISEKKSNKTFEIYNTDIKTDGGSTKITTTIKNISVEKTEEQIIEIVLLDKSSNEIAGIKAVVPSLESGKSTKISTEALTVYEGIYDFKIR